MSKELLCAIMLIIFFGVMVYVGFYSRKHAKDVNGFVLGGRGVGPWLTAFAFGTSYFSAVIFVGYAGQFGWNFGLASTWAGLGNAFIGSLLAWNVLGRRTRVMTQHIDAKTMPDFFGKRFNSTPLKVAASIIVFIFLIPYTSSLYNGLSSLFGLVFDIPYWVVIAVMAVLTGVYVIFGGYMATAINDFIQGIIMLFGICAVIGAVLVDNGGLVNATKNLSAITGDAGWQGAYSSFLGPDPLALLFVVVLTSLGTWGLPQMVGKFYAIKSEKDIQGNIRMQELQKRRKHHDDKNGHTSTSHTAFFCLSRKCGPYHEREICKWSPAIQAGSRMEKAGIRIKQGNDGKLDHHSLKGISDPAERKAS